MAISDEILPKAKQQTSFSEQPSGRETTEIDTKSTESLNDKENLPAFNWIDQNPVAEV